MQTNRDIVRAVKAAIKKATTIKRVPATIVSAGSLAGMTTIRYTNGQTADVLNYRMGSVPNLRVYIGRDPIFPEILQVLGPRFSYKNMGALFKYFILDHHANHEWPGHDTVWVQAQQILPLLVLPETLFTVKILEGWFPTPTTYVHVLEQLVDLSASQPTAGALYALLQIDDTGIATAKIGTQVDAKELLMGGDIPMADEEKYPLAAVRLYDGQTKITADLRSTLNDIVDLRFGGYSLAGGAGGLKPVNPSITGNFVSFADTVGVLADSGFSEASFVHVETLPTISHDHVLFRWSGAVSQTTFDLLDYVDTIESLEINGLVEDPTVYSLSSDGGQIVLDNALTTAALITAHCLSATI